MGAPTTEQRYLQFSLGPEFFVMPLLNVREVVGMPDTTPIPYAPPHFLGMMNLRGQVISVIDLRKKMNITSKAPTSENAVIIIDLNPVYIGVVVDSINKVVSVKPEEIGAPPDLEGGKKLDYLVGVIRQDEQLSIIINIAKLLNLDDLKSIQSAKAS